MNQTAPAGPLPEDLAAEARAVFDPVYRFCRARFGDELPEAWQT